MNDTTDWYTTVPLAEGIDQIDVTVGKQSSVFVIAGTDDRVVIDTGRGVGDLRGYLQERYDGPFRLFLTHSHWDHVGNAHQFDPVSIHPLERNPDGSLTLDVLSPVFLDRPAQFVASHREQGLPFPAGFDPDAFAVPPVERVETHEGGDVVAAGDRELEVYDIPGHSRGQTAFLDRTAGVLFGADIVHRDGGAYVHFDDSSLEEYVSSLETVISLRDSGAFDTLLTAHNPPLVGEELRILEALRDGLLAIGDGEHESDVIETPWGDAREYYVGDSRVLTKPTVG